MDPLASTNAIVESHYRVLCRAAAPPPIKLLLAETGTKTGVLKANVSVLRASTVFFFCNTCCVCCVVLFRAAATPVYIHSYARDDTVVNVTGVSVFDNTVPRGSAVFIVRSTLRTYEVSKTTQ